MFLKIESDVASFIDVAPENLNVFLRIGLINVEFLVNYNATYYFSSDQQCTVSKLNRRFLTRGNIL